MSILSICCTHNPIYYTYHHYEFNYLQLIRIINSSTLSYVINNEYPLIPFNFFNHSNFNEISYTYPSTLPLYNTNQYRRLISNSNEKSITIQAEASGKSLSILCKNNNKIEISEASYGKNCKPTNLNNELNNLQTICNNKQQCEYKINHLKIGDPAIGCAKTYIYKYKCVSEMNYKLPKMNVESMNKLHLKKHRKTLKTHITNIKELILNEMAKRFKQNNKQSILLQKINDL